MHNRDLVVVGGSAGALPAVAAILEHLPPDLPAAILVTLHRHPSERDWLSERLAQRSRWTVRTVDDERIERGIAYIARPDRHLIVKEGRVFASHGPHENQWRPAIDVMFRSAAVAYTSRVIGVLLSGELDDGTSGLEAIKRCGGLTVIQRPENALYPTMPEVAAANVRIDYSVDVAEMVPLIRRLVGESAPQVPAASTELQAEALMAEGTQALTTQDFAEHSPSPLTCPECGGPLWQRDAEGKEFRCLVGHAHRIESLQVATDAALDRTLWAAIRQFEQRANIARMMSQQSRHRQQRVRGDLHEARAAEAEAHAQKLRELQALYRTPLEPSQVS